MNTNYRMPPVLMREIPSDKLYHARLSKIYRRIVVAHIVGFICFFILTTIVDETLPDAANIGDYATVDTLTRLGFPADSADSEANITPLMKAADSGNVEIVKLLLQRGANVRAETNFWGTTALDYALGNPKMVSLLLAQGADVNHRNKAGDSPLILAAHDGSLEVVKVLYAQGADTTLRDRNGHDARYRAEFNGHTNVVRFLKHLPER